MAEVQTRLNYYWSARAAAYHQAQTESERAPYDQALWREVFSQALNCDHGTIVDVGCGSGFASHLLAEAGHDVYGIDSCAGMLVEACREARERKQQGLNTANFCLGDAINPAWETHSVDAVVSRYVLWTLTDPATAIRNWARMVKPGGRVVAADGLWFPTGIDPDIQVESAHGPGSFAHTYDDHTMSHLPLGKAARVDDYAALFASAGLESVEVSEVSAVHDLDQRFGLSKGHSPATQFVVSGVVTDRTHQAIAGHSVREYA